MPFLNAGRLVEVKDGEHDFGWGVVIAYNKIINPKVSGHAQVNAMIADQQGRPPVVLESDPPQKGYVVDVLIRIASDAVVPKDRSSSGINPPRGDDQGQVAIIGVLLSTIQSISQFRINLPKDLRGAAEKNTAFKAVGEIKRRMPDGPTLLDPIKNMGINDKSFRDLVKVCHQSIVELSENSLLTTSK